MKPLDKPSAPSTSPRESSSPSSELSLSSSETSSSRESEAVVAKYASMAVEETPGIAREETPRKLDSPDTRANIRWEAADTTAKINKKREGSCRRPPAMNASPRELSSPSDELHSSSSESKSSLESDAVEVKHASGVEIHQQQANHARLLIGGHIMGEGELLIRA